MIVAYIDAYRDSFGVEPICRVLKEHDYQIAPSTYYAFKLRPPSNRAINDEILLDHIKRVHRDNYSCYGVRKVWYSLLDDDEVLIKPGRDQVARLMRRAGLRGIRRLKRIITTVSDPTAAKSEDLVKREWDQGAPDRVWVADFTEVRSREGVVYVAFVQDAGTRNILGFNVRTSRPAELVETALEQAVSMRSRVRGRHWLADGSLICHSDRGSQYTSIAFGRKLREHRIKGSMGAVGTSADNALMESTIGLYKAELIYRRSWRSRQEIESATAAWVTWFNQKRLHSELGYKSPAQFEREYYQNQALLRQAV